MTATTSTERRELAQWTRDATEVSLTEDRHRWGPTSRREPACGRPARRRRGSARVRHIDEDLERHRTALTVHCTRMLGSRSEAEDAVQETLLRAWRSRDRFQRPSALRSWLHRIATNVCIDMLRSRSRSPVPVDPALLHIAPLHAGADTDPAEKTLTREAFGLALLTAIEQLPPQQRVVILLREVMSWKAIEVAQLLGISRAAVNSSLQRARATLHSNAAGADPATSRMAEHASETLLASYLAALPS